MLKITKLILATAFTFASSSAWSMSLEEAVAVTIATDPELKSAFNDFMSTRQDIDAAQGDYYPDIDLSAGYGYEYINNSSTKAGGDKSFNRKDANLSLTQLIWDGSTLNNIDRTEYEAEAQRFQLLSDAQDKTLTVTEAYVSVLLSQQLLALSEDNVGVHEKIKSDIERRAESGIGSTADLSQIEARVARAITNMLAARSNVIDAETEFFRLVGLEIESPVDPEVDQLFLPSSLKEAVNVAFELNPVIRLATHDIDAARAQYRQNKGNFYPTFTVEANQSWTNDANGVEESVDEFSAMLRMRWNLYNGGSDKANTKRSAYQLNKSKDIFENAARLLKESTRLAWSAYELTEEQKKFLADHVDAASETVIAYEKQFKIGRRTLLDLLNTENELFEARRSYLDAHYANINAKYRVLNSTGMLLDALRIDVPQEWQEPVVNNEG